MCTKLKFRRKQLAILLWIHAPSKCEDQLTYELIRVQAILINFDFDWSSSSKFSVISRSGTICGEWRVSNHLAAKWSVKTAQKTQLTALLEVLILSLKLDTTFILSFNQETQNEISIWVIIIIIYHSCIHYHMCN